VTRRHVLATCVGLALATPVNGQAPVIAQPVPAQSGSQIIVPAGTIIDLVTTNTVSSKKSVKGDLLYLKVATPVTVDGMVALPADTVVVAQLTRAEQRGAFGRSGKLDVQLLYAELPGGTLRVSGAVRARGKNGADDAAATAAAFLMLPFVATGRSAEIPAGSEVSARLDRSIAIDRR
jgi:hypothetical protein